MNNFKFCMVETIDCDRSAICWRHKSHHKECCHAGYRTIPTERCADFIAIDAIEDDGFVTLHPKMGALS